MRDFTPDSSFYGSDDEKSRLEALSTAYDPAPFLRGPFNLTELALRRSCAPKPPPAERFNIYADNSRAKQLDETLATFLTRLPPSTTPAAPTDPWIYAASPGARYRHGDVATLRTAGESILADLAEAKHAASEAAGTRGAGAATRKLNAAKRDAQRRIAEEARRCGVGGGKWLLFVTPRDVDRVWAAVAEATVGGELGDAAKVGTDEGKGDAVRLVCVYTEDCADEKDVRRVLAELDNRGLVPRRGPMGEERGIYYKSEAFTHLGITSGNEWELPASMFSSRDMLGARGTKRKA